MSATEHSVMQQGWWMLVGHGEWNGREENEVGSKWREGGG